MRKYQCYQWRKANILPFKHAIAAFGTAIVGLLSQIAYGSWQEICYCFNWIWRYWTRNMNFFFFLICIWLNWFSFLWPTRVAFLPRPVLTKINFLFFYFMPLFATKVYLYSILLLMADGWKPKFHQYNYGGWHVESQSIFQN